MHVLDFGALAMGCLSLCSTSWLFCTKSLDKLMQRVLPILSLMRMLTRTPGALAAEHMAGDRCTLS